jgi:hypothetical protein
MSIGTTKCCHIAILVKDLDKAIANKARLLSDPDFHWEDL